MNSTVADSIQPLVLSDNVMQCAAAVIAFLPLRCMIHFSTFCTPGPYLSALRPTSPSPLNTDAASLVHPTPSPFLVQMSSPSSLPPPPLRAVFYSSVSPSHPPRTSRGTGDILVDNTPFNLEYHLAITSPVRVVYDLPARCEPRGAIAVPVDSALRLALVRQWRPVPSSTGASGSFPADARPRGFWSLELPRGFPEDGETGADAAQRETEEETGLAAMAVQPLAWLNFNTAVFMTDQPVFLVAVDEKVAAEGVEQDEGENIIGVRWYSVAELKEAVLSGGIRCGITLAALAHVFSTEARGGLRDFVEAPLAKVGGEHYMRAVAMVLERFACEMWEMGLELGEFDVQKLRFEVESEKVRDEALVALSAGGRFYSSSGVLRSSKSHIIVAGVALTELQFAVSGSCALPGHVVYVQTRGDVAELVERYPTLKWTTAQGKRTDVSLGASKLTIVFGSGCKGK